jgi:predicted transcriptional regulator
MSMVEKWVAKFRAADADRREEIVEEASDQIKNAWREDLEFDRGMITSVCILSTKSGRSYMLL